MYVIVHLYGVDSPLCVTMKKMTERMWLQNEGDSDDNHNP